MSFGTGLACAPKKVPGDSSIMLSVTNMIPKPILAML